MKIFKNGALLLFITVLFSQPGLAQLAKLELGVNAGWFVYQGDLTPSRFGSFKTKHFGIDLYVSKPINNTFSLRTNLAISKLEGDDSRFSFPEYRQQRNFYFKSPLLEVSEILVGNILPQKNNGKQVVPYAFGGIGLAFLNIKRDWSRINREYFPPGAEIWSGLAIDSAHSTQRIIPVIPAGIGVKYFISEKWAVTVEGSYRFSFTDYIDGFSQSVNPKQNDHYYSVTIGISHTSGVYDRLKCPQLRY
jgi:hypothetical protein